MIAQTVHRWIPWLVLGLVTVIAFSPVLSGTFLFDDYANLTSLGQYGPIDDSAALARYLSSGIADPLGRPVAMATFLLDATDWPATPAPFLRTNLVLHVLNALLLAVILHWLGRFLSLPESLGRKAAVAGAMFWALHPLWVSTVGYIVQRHALMSTLFVFLGVLAWTAGVAAFRREQTTRGWIWTAAIVPGLGLLAALSKANGMLLPLLLLVLHYFILSRDTAAGTSERRAVTWLLVIPSLMLLVVLLATLDPNPAGRPWSLAERLMSQPRILLDYLWHLLLPRVNSLGIFGDAVPLSTGWLQPRTTLPAAIIVLGLVCAPFALRQRWPALAAALAFYLAAHVLESTVVPLELYFEHRNYLPAALLGWPLALALLRVRIRAPLRAGAVLALLMSLGLLTHTRATLWSDGPRQADVWAKTIPGSPRAQTWKAQYDLEGGRLAEAASRLRRALDAHPGNPMLALNLLDVECNAGRLSGATLRNAAQSVSQRGLTMDVTHVWLRDKVLGGAAFCPNLDEQIIAQLLRATGSSSQRTPEGKARYFRLQAMMALRSGDCQHAQNLLRQIISIRRRDDEAFADTALIASNCGPGPAMQHLDAYLSSSASDPGPPFGMQRVHHWVLSRQGYWTSELGRLRAILAAELAEAGQEPEEGTAR